MIELIKVENNKAFSDFLNFPEKLYFHILKNTHYIMPLKLITKLSIGNFKKKTSISLFMIKEKGEVKARLGLKLHKGKVHFGFFEAVPDRFDIVEKLFSHAFSLYKDHEFIGPYNFRMEDPYVGLMVEGHSTDPYFMMSYNPSYYKEYFEKLELHKVMDLLTYDVLGKTELPVEMKEKAIALQNQGYSLRALTHRSMKRDVKIIAGIFNDALSDNWGYEELTKNQIQDMYLMFKFFINPKLVVIASDETGNEVGCLIMLPNFNKFLKNNKGRLTPSLLWNVLTKRKKIDSARGYALGIKKSHHGKGVGSYLIWHGWKRSVKIGGIKKGEISWILSNNEKMNSLTVKMKGKPNRKYRVYSNIKP